MVGPGAVLVVLAPMPREKPVTVGEVRVALLELARSIPVPVVAVLVTVVPVTAGAVAVPSEMPLVAPETVPPLIAMPEAVEAAVAVMPVATPLMAGSVTVAEPVVRLMP